MPLPKINTLPIWWVRICKVISALVSENPCLQSLLLGDQPILSDTIRGAMLNKMCYNKVSEEWIGNASWYKQIQPTNNKFMLSQFLSLNNLTIKLIFIERLPCTRQSFSTGSIIVNESISACIALIIKKEKKQWTNKCILLCQVMMSGVKKNNADKRYAEWGELGW